MEDLKDKFQTFLNENSVSGDYLSFTTTCHTVEDAARAANASVLDIVKNICCMADDGRLIVVTLKGEDRLSLLKVGEYAKASTVRMATQEEVLTKTGYPCGGVPSFGYDALFLVDTRVIERAYIYTGAGSDCALFKMSPQELLRVNGGKVVDVRK